LNDSSSEQTLSLTRLACPRCSAQLVVDTLKIDDEEAGQTELLLLFDCPTGDYHSAIRQQDVVEMITEEVMRRLC
jgi:hypothetical protein